MRPRHKAAENHHHVLRVAGELQASMRPRHKAAENKNLIFTIPIEGNTLQ